jgi:tRNA dimethylallyltransferase
LGGAELRIICGPTAAGKSAIALALAERHGGTLISADSRQVYRGFDIGTAKPTHAERARVPHEGIDVADPEERYSAARWAESADSWLARARALNRTPLVVGGTGLYMRALIAPLFREPLLDASRRAELATELSLRTTEELRAWCARVDPPLARLGRTQLLRAIEIATLTGERLSDLHATEARATVHSARYLVVDPGASLGARIEARVDAMLAAGWVDEVKRLATQVSPEAPAWKAAGYRWIRAMVEGRAAERQARERVIIETRQYAKRQRTWFRHQLPAERTTRISPDESGWSRIVEAWWDGET